MKKLNLKNWEHYKMNQDSHDLILRDLIEYSFDLRKQIRILSISILITSASIILLTLTK